MLNQVPLLALTIYSFCLWFGLYLIQRDFSKQGLRYAGAGIVAYALGLGMVTLLPDEPQYRVWQFIPIVLPLLFWMRATVHLIPDMPQKPYQQRFFVLMVSLTCLSSLSVLFDSPVTRILVWGLPLLFLANIVLSVREALRMELPRFPLAAMLTAAIFLLLGSGLIVFPLEALQQEWALWAISVDMIVLGLVIVTLDTYDEGTALRLDVLRSFAGAFIGTLIFGGQIVMMMIITNDTSLALQVLSFGVVTAFLVMYTLSGTLQKMLDRFIFVERPDVVEQREVLRTASDALVRLDPTHEWLTMPEDEFARLTRRALSHYANLDKLASSPLVELPLIADYLDGDDHILARAAALKLLLKESIENLKPLSDDKFSSADEWRYYNALYFPYVVGLKPYSKRFYRDDLSESEQAALDWLRTYVPERTLYNWQKTAATLIAQHLRERMQPASAFRKEFATTS